MCENATVTTTCCSRASRFFGPATTTAPRKTCVHTALECHWPPTFAGRVRLPTQLGLAASQQQREPSCGASSGCRRRDLAVGKRGPFSARDRSVHGCQVKRSARGCSKIIDIYLQREQASVRVARAPLVSEVRPWPKVLSAQLRPHEAARPSPPPGPAAAAVAVRLPARFMRRMRRTYANAARSAPAASAHLNKDDSDAVET